MPRALPLLALVLAAAPRTAAQDPAPPPAAPTFAVGVRPDTVTVGDRFVVVLRARLPPGARAEFPARLDSTPDLHPVGDRIERAAAAGDRVFAYPMVAWRPGAPPPLFADVRVAHADGRVETERVRLALPFVRSVLPADSSRVEPRGPHDVLGPDWDRRLVALLAALVVLSLMLLPTGTLVRRWLRRRRARPGAQPRDPRSRALAALERARTARHVERGEWKAFYTLTSEALRDYLGALSPRWSPDLTTDELARALAVPDVRSEDAASLMALLAHADAVKFARAPSTPAEAERHWRAARAWVEGFDEGEPAAAPQPAATEEVAG
ncbi:MAG TPA: hypothetical protein VHG51_12555 [Longimicrobiaceae bacterium]|nr:hypothetical protein [Longimicrobiaceae bacterium]